MVVRLLLVLLGVLAGGAAAASPDVTWGERTIDEMGHAAILYTFDDEKIDPPRR